MNYCIWSVDSGCPIFNGPIKEFNFRPCKQHCIVTTSCKIRFFFANEECHELAIPECNTCFCIVPSLASVLGRSVVCLLSVFLSILFQFWVKFDTLKNGSKIHCVAIKNICNWSLYISLSKYTFFIVIGVRGHLVQTFEVS